MWLPSFICRLGFSKSSLFSPRYSGPANGSWSLILPLFNLLYLVPFLLLMLNLKSGPFSVSGSRGSPLLPPVGCLMSFWFKLWFDASPLDVCFRPYSFNPRALPPFYKSLLLAWWGLDGSFSAFRNSLVYGSSSPHVCLSVSHMSTKTCYLFVLSENMVSPHCVEKFAPTYGALDWPSTWGSLSFFDLDSQVTDLCWKIAHGLLYTMQRLASFGMPVPLPFFCGAPVESLEHLFFYCPLAQSVLSWLQSLMFSFPPMCQVILCRHVLFGFNSHELRVTPRVFVYLLNVLKLLIWHSRNNFRFCDIRPGTAEIIVKVKTRVRFNIPLFFKRFISLRHRRYFHRQWGTGGVVASVAAGQLFVNI